MSLNLNLLSCPKCGGKLNDLGEGRYSCAFCNREWEREVDNSFDKILGGFNEAIQAEKAANIARLKRALYEETHKKFVSNSEVERLCKDILEHFDDEDFYARFYLATCDSDRNAFSKFCESCDIAAREDDVADILRYLTVGLREEWISNVSDIIERAYKNKDVARYSECRTTFEKMAAEVQSGIFEPTLHRDVFVMYSGKDMDKVLKMVSVLENGYDLTCFVAAKNLRHGAGSVDVYKNAIHTAIKNCDIHLLISTENSRSRQCEVYEEILYIMENCPNHPRVEYLAENYRGYGVEAKFKEFFSGLEYCTSYEDTAERISDYCDSIKSGKIIVGETAKSTVKVEAASDELEKQLSKAKRFIWLKKYDEAYAEYEALADSHSNDIRPFIGMVAAVSENYTNLSSAEAENHINMVNGIFGENTALAADKEYAAYVAKFKGAKEAARIEEEARKKREREEAERRAAEEAERARKAEEERRRKEAEDRLKREREEAERRAAEEARKKREREEEERRAREAEEARKRAEAEAKRKAEEAARSCYTKSGNNIIFGSWPQTKVTDSSLVSSLNLKAGALPKNGSNGSWTSYKYYIKDSNSTDFMWYKDVEHNGERYRGVYFTSYRPSWTNTDSSDNNQSENGYSTGRVYWFKWEPVKWKILTEIGDKALLISDLLIDSQEYYDNWNNRTASGRTVYPNNYAHSNIRKWLTETFYKTAFSEMQKSLIQLTNIDNSVSSTGDSTNQYACENTSDRVFLLSIQELNNSGYGFGSNSTRKKKPTEYAKCQGAYVGSGGAGLWWSRSPVSDGSGLARVVNRGGSFYYSSVNNTYYGVCPALWISL